MIIEHIIPFLVVLAIAVSVFVATRCHHEFTVCEGYSGLLYHAGKLVETLAPGRHVRWGRQFQLVQIDARRTMLAVPGQDVLTADNIGVKLSLVLTIQIADAAKAVTTVDNYSTHVYNAAQIALRASIAASTLDALLGQRIAIGEQLRVALIPQVAAIGITLHAVEVRDVMLPGDLRKAFADVLKAKQEGQVALERARSESAALRNLANAARMVADQPALATLRFLQTLETSNGKNVVLNDLSALAPFAIARKQRAQEAD